MTFNLISLWTILISYLDGKRDLDHRVLIEREYKKRFSTNKFFDEDYEKTYMNYQKKLLQKKEGLQKLAKIKSQILNEFLYRKESKDYADRYANIKSCETKSLN